MKNLDDGDGGKASMTVNDKLKLQPERARVRDTDVYPLPPGCLRIPYPSATLYTRAF